MALPTPEPGLVIRFNYLWARKAELGRDNARYARPCAIVVARRTSGRVDEVMLVPVTHSPPGDNVMAIEMPPRVKAHLGLDDQRSWVVVDEMNVFQWPGFDLAPDAEGRIAYGVLPPGLFSRIREGLIEAARAGRMRRVGRGEP